MSTDGPFRKGHEVPVSPKFANPGRFLKFRLMRPADAVNFFRKKGYHIGFDWRDTEPAAHKTSFTAAKIMQMDILEDIRKYVDKGLADGVPFDALKNDLKKALADKGWWGEKEVINKVTGEVTTIKVDAWRLRRIYNTNLRTAHTEGQWKRIQENKDMFPYLVYDGCNSSENRADHCSWDRMVLPVDDPWWTRHFPVKEFGCKCRAFALTRGQVERRGLKPGFKGTGESPPEKFTTWENPRTKQVMRVPNGVHPAFNYPPGGWYDALDKLAAEKLAALPPALQEALNPPAKSAKEAMIALHGAAWYKNTLASAKRAATENGLMGYGLSDDELVALRAWSSEGVRINRAIRENDPAYALYVDTLKAALDKLPSYSGTTRAGMGHLPFTGELSPGSVIVLDTFVSTTRGRPLPGKYKFMVLSRAGKPVDKISGKPDELEVLFKPGAMFKILNVEHEGSTIVVTIMEQSS